MRTSHKKNRPFDFKLIDLVEPNALLYKRQTGLSNYETMKGKNEIWAKISAQMGRDTNFCVMRWNNLRYQYQKELRRSMELCPKLGIIRGSTWPYLERLSFLKDLTIPLTKSKALIKKQEKSRSTKLEAEKFEDSEGSTQEYEQNTPLQLLEDTSYAIIEEIIEHPNEEEIIEEEIIYEDTEEDEADEDENEDMEHIKHLTTATEFINDSNVSNMQRIDELLAGIQETQRERVEKRIMAYALKCQLRTLMSQTIDDLVI